MPPPPFENGQVWQMNDSSVRIGLVGKTLVHYKHYSEVVKRPTVQLMGKRALGRFLQKNAAVLLPDAPPSVPDKQKGAGGKAFPPSTNKSHTMSKPQLARAD